jgi:hypothetical protein
MAKNIAQSLPEKQQAAFLAAMQKNINMVEIKTAAQAGLVKVFTADELKASNTALKAKVALAAVEGSRRSLN